MPGRRWIIAVAVAIGATVALTVVGHPGADYRHSDFFQFWAAPRLLLEGRDPYDAVDWASIYAREATAPVATPPPPARHVYPPWSAALLLPLGLLPFDLAAALWVVAQLTAVIVALRILATLYLARAEERALLFGLAAAFQPLWLIVGGGNITGFLLGLFTVGLAAAIAGPRTAGIPIGILAVKPHPFVIALPALLAVAEARASLFIGAVGTFLVLVLATLPFGPRLFGEWLGAALDLQGTTGSNATVWTIGRVLPGGPVIAVLLAVAALAGLVGWWRVRRPPPLTALAGSVAISVFVAPHGWSYDATLLLITLAAILAAAGRLSGTRRIALLAAIAIVATGVPWALYALAFGRGGEEWSALTPLAFFALLAVTTPPRGQARRPTP